MQAIDQIKYPLYICCQRGLVSLFSQWAASHGREWAEIVREREREREEEEEERSHFKHIIMKPKNATTTN